MSQTFDFTDFFSSMLRIRRVEEKIADEYINQQMRCPVHLSIGQEAVAVAICSHLTKKDYLISNHRAHAHYLAKGGSLPKMIAEIYGKETGCSKGRGGSMHLVDLSVGMMGSTPIVGGSIPVGVGMAFSSYLKKENRITAIFFGEGATEEGVVAECFNFAALHSLPVLFVCENNLYSVYSPLSVRQAKTRDRVNIAKSHGMNAIAGNGYDCKEAWSLAKEVVGNIRNGKGPQYLELSTYRFREHCGPNFDNEIGYRTEKEAKNWESRCPIKIGKEAFSQKQLQAMEYSICKEIEEAFAFAHASAFASVGEGR